MEKEIVVDLGQEKKYSIFVGSGNLGTLGAKMKELGLKGRVLVITNPQIERLYALPVKKSLVDSGYDVRVLSIPAGEEQKNLKTIAKIYDVLVEGSFDRDTVIVALGGGIVGDMAGFVAATFMRGVRYVQVPTTLLAQVDSAVGGKTGFNHSLGKNMIGAFYQPSLVLIDTLTLQSLPEREIHSGIAEIIKYGLIKKKSLFDQMIKETPDKTYERAKGLLIPQELLVRVITACCTIKAEVVMEDEKEKNIRAILNFGHTFGHAIEAVTEYKRYTHGEAVALGMICACGVSIDKGYIEETVINQLITLYKKINLPFYFEGECDMKKLFGAMKRDKKVKDKAVRLILLKKIGQAVVESFEDDKILAAGFQRICREDK
jgi:3-dehydroquinate synthase